MAEAEDGDDMTHSRRSPEDYQPEANRFEEWLMFSEGISVDKIDNIDELIDKIEAWLQSIDVYGHSQGNFAKSLLTYLLSRNMIPSVSSRPKEVQIIQSFRVNRSGSKWLSSEERVLARLWVNPNVSTGYITRELARTKSSLYSKARKLGVKRPKNARKR
jgi:hypothetical protein